MESVPDREKKVNLLQTVYFELKTVCLCQTRGYRSDGYDWKTRKVNSKSIREDRMKLKVCGMQVSLWLHVK